MKRPDWKSLLEIVGVTAVVLSLLFVGLELRQSRLIARVGVYNTLLSSQIEINDAISNNADVWAQGAAGGELSAEDTVIFERLVNDINERAITEYVSEDLLGNTGNAQAVMGDFAILLHQNPGARRVWETREANLNRYRQMLEPEVELQFSYWQRDISELLDVLDRRAD